MNSMTELTPQPEQSIPALFAKDPDDLTSEDIAAITSHLRSQRETWVMEKARAKAAGTRPNYRVLTKEATAKLSLDDIEL